MWPDIGKVRLVVQNEEEEKLFLISQIRFLSAKMINDDGNEVVLFSEEKKYLLSLLKNVFASPTLELYEVHS